MNTIVISDKLFNKKLKEENIEKFRQEIGEGKYDNILFSSTREIAFPDGIVLVDKKNEGELPLFTFSCAPWECIQLIYQGVPNFYKLGRNWQEFYLLSLNYIL